MSEASTETANRAILALTVISILGILAGILSLFVQQEAGSVLAVVSGAVGGIVAIVLKQSQNGKT